ncbi:multicopper oxidase domain-containing protein [Halorientalis brevis]|uniref:Multicopper oxidase domain-containing protein n=1 Tax=Halorientalis brevis TaxID=1126241 RepID=A0ABD6C7M8_9EURY|nr:multicopper oxidase domain-containing protein [Halorientalis brevis]
MPSNNDPQSATDETDPLAGDATRRDFLKGSGTVAGSGMLFSGSDVQPFEEALAGCDETVPDEPTNGGKVCHFEVHAIDVDIVYNRYGLHQPVGVMYALKDDLDRIREVSGKRPCGNNVVFEDEDAAFFCDDVPDDELAGPDSRLIQPLTLRANKGDIIEIEFHNDLDRHASMHQTSLPYDVEDSDGMEVGFNPNTTVPPGESITYRWHARHFGGHFFLDGANQAFDSAEEDPQEVNLLSRGLFGSVVVHPKGTTWTDPYTGEEVQGRVQADVHVPDEISEEAQTAGFVPGVSFRQFIVHYHTPEGIQTADGGELTYPNDDTPQTVHAINYRADPTGNRIPTLDLDDPDIEELSENFYSSWLHGDPGGGDNVYPMYVGDPVMAIPMGASVEENHVHHLHGHRWKETPPLDESDTIDSQTVGNGAVHHSPYVTAAGTPRAGINDFTSVRPGMDFDESFEVGAGGAHKTTGDVLFHCHLFPHYGEGMWGVMRVLDKEREGLKKLPNNDPPLDADSAIPGFPEFIPGKFGDAPPFPPYGAAGLNDFRNPEPDEEEALTRRGEILPGAPYTDPCDPEIDDDIYDGPETEFEGEKQEYTIVALPADIVYNDDGHHDPNGIVYVLEEHADLVREGKMNPEPLVIRANVGDCVEITFKNEVTEENIAAIPGDRFPENPPDQDIGADTVPIEEGGKSNHIHFVSYDLLGSDSLATGFNYRQDAQPDERNKYRWYADEEGTIFFHDHITGIEDVMHGSFAAIVVEPPGSEWLDPYSGEPIRSGTQAIIDPEDGDAYREFCVAYQDFAQLIDRDGELVNNQQEHNENAGVMALNYRNTPYYTRNDEDPAYVHSSFVHGDPSTPVFEAYEDDPVRFRLWQGVYEEQHNFTIHGRRFDDVGVGPENATTQVIGTSEAFTFDLQQDQNFVDGDHDHKHGQKHGHHDHKHGRKHGQKHGHKHGRKHGRKFFEELDVNPAGLPIRDYVYGSAVVDDLWDGMWGLFREFGGRVDHLHPLPDCEPPDEKIHREELKEMGHPAPWSDFDWSEYGQLARLLYGKDDDRRFPPDKDARQNDAIDGNPPPLAPTPGDPCPDDVCLREFDVTAFNTEIEYNEFGDHDPLGIAYALDCDVEEIKNGDLPLTPLVLRANQGDCIEVTLTNDIDFDEIDVEHDHPEMQGPDQEWERSERISIHAKQLFYDVLGSDGTTAGFNWDQTIGPGESITYRWFVNGISTSAVLHDYADLRSNRHHGAYGRLIVEQEGVKFLDPTTAEPAPQGRADSAMLKVPHGTDRRDFALAFADGQYILNENDPDDCVVPPGPDVENPDAPCNQLGDPEDHGYQAINYRSAPFERRFEEDLEPWQVYASDIDPPGDPDTPIPRAMLGDPVTFRVQKTADKADGLVFHLSDHQWLRLDDIEESDTIGVNDDISVTRSDSITPLGGAGGLAESTGDFIYQETRQRRKLEAGYWGIFRVRDRPEEFETPVQPLPDVAEHEGYYPEDRPGWNVSYGDVTGNGHDDVLIGVPDSSLNGHDAGAAYVFYGPVDEREILDLLDADAQLLGESAGDRAGRKVKIVGNSLLVDATCRDTPYVIDGHEKPEGTCRLGEIDTMGDEH